MKQKPIMKHPLALGFMLVFLTILSDRNITAKTDCDKAKSTVDLHECAAQDFETADKELNRTYKQLAKAVERVDGKEAKEELVAAQRAWITFRDKECLFGASVEKGGSMYPIIIDSCMTELTDKRTEDLKDYIKLYKKLKPER